MHLITLAQALTVLGIPALAATLIYLGTRPELENERQVPRWILGLAWVGLIVACVLACLTARKVYQKLEAKHETMIRPRSGFACLGREGVFLKCHVDVASQSRIWVVREDSV